VNGEAVGEGSTTLDWTFRLIENPLYNISVVAADSLESDTVNWEVSVRDLGVRNGKENGLNQRFSILDISPNPFNDWTSIHYSLPVTSLLISAFNICSWRADIPVRPTVNIDFKGRTGMSALQGKASINCTH